MTSQPRLGIPAASNLGTAPFVAIVMKLSSGNYTGEVIMCFCLSDMGSEHTTLQTQVLSQGLSNGEMQPLNADVRVERQLLRQADPRSRMEP